MLRAICFSVLVLFPLLLPGPGFSIVQAHELRPAYLEISEKTGDSYDILWKVPARGNAWLSLYVLLPENCTGAPPSQPRFAGNAAISRWTVNCTGGLAGGTITIDGLSSTLTDVLARIVRIDGTVQTSRITPTAPSVTVVESPGAASTAATYFVLGVEHILFGIDHLLFVLALLLLIRSVRTLIETITAFTVAHSITLGLTALGVASPAVPPVEAMIALSIVFVASEILRLEKGQESFAIRYPFVVAFVFGLLHGFGFGGALRDIGLPQKDVPLALLTFNLGVEVGQLLFVGAVLIAIALVRLLALHPVFHSRRAVAYMIGCISAFWFVQRLSTFAG